MIDLKVRVLARSKSSEVVRGSTIQVRYLSVASVSSTTQFRAILGFRLGLIEKSKRVIDWNQTFAGITYGNAPIDFNATVTGSGDFNYTSSNQDVIEINGTKAIIRGAGTVVITANAAESALYWPADSVTKTITVSKAPLTISGTNVSITVGDSMPDLNWTASGWKHEDESALLSSVFTTVPTVSTDAANSSVVGTYYVRPSGALSDNYSFTYVDGQFTILSLTEQTIAWGQDFSGVGVGQTVELNASASSNLAVLYSVDDTSVAELAVTHQSALKAWWKLDETSGDAADSSAFSNTGSLRNGATYNAGKFGNAITLDGTDDHIRTYGYTGINETAGRTVALWFKTLVADKPILRMGLPAPELCLSYQLTPGRCGVRLRWCHHHQFHHRTGRWAGTT